MNDQHSQPSDAEAQPPASPPGSQPPVPTPPSVFDSIKTPKSTRLGKVARLPEQVRNRINRMMCDGMTYADIIEALGDDGKDLNEQNLSNWKSGGYCEWSRQQERREDVRARQDAIIDLVRHHHIANLSKAAFQVAVTQVFELLADLDPATLREALSADPTNYTRLLNSLVKLGDGEIKCERLRLDASEQAAKLGAEKDVEGKAGLSDDGRSEIEENRFNPPL